MALASGGGAKPKYLPVSAIDYVSGYLMALGTMAALARRAAQGGSWLVCVSPARWTRPPVPLGHDRSAWEDSAPRPNAAA